jgi:hypothetical protein
MTSSWQAQKFTELCSCGVKSKPELPYDPKLNSNVFIVALERDINEPMSG